MRQLLATATAVLLLTGLAACSDDDPTPKFEESTESQEPSISATSTGTPTPSTPTETDPTPEAPSAFVMRFLATSAEMQISGDSEAYRLLTLRCESCDSLADRIDAIYLDGGEVITGDAEVKALERVGGHDGVFIFEYTLVSPRTTVRKGDGSIDIRLPGGSERYQLNVTKVSSSWKVLRISQLVP